MLEGWLISLKYQRKEITGQHKCGLNKFEFLYEGDA